MKNLITSAIFFLFATLLLACHKETEDEKAQPLLDSIEVQVDKGDFGKALEGITKLRAKYPKAIQAREKALDLWQKASLLQAQREVEKTDSALQVTLMEIEKAPTLLEQNMLRNKRDSLKARYDAECGVVRIIRAKQKEAQN